MKNLLLAVVAAASASFAAVPSHYDGGRNTPVHRLALNDEFGDTIVPDSPGALPVSTRKTCGRCHDYDTIAKGWHFNMSTAEAIGRPSQPWFLIDQVSGSQVPMSLRTWPGMYKPAQLGMSNWDWVYTFGRNLPGGDIADPADLYAEGGPHARWEVTGPVEINCFACHSTDKAYDHSEWARLISRQNFRWAATGALGLGEVRGMGERVKDYWGVLRGLNPDDKIYAVPPHVVYDQNKFDSKNRTVLELGKPRNENCLNCHSATQAGMHSKDVDGDVHLRAGMTCSDCHGNGLEHATARGSEKDPTGMMDKSRATASCVGCHMGGKGAKVGRHGAPAPKHVGIPLSHFDKLSCTACHAGVTEDGKLAQVRTSQANRMGIYGRARWATAQPFIMEPVFVKNCMGKIEPRRMVWPAYWAARDAKDATKLAPLAPAKVQEIAKSVLDVREQVNAVLAALATDPNVPGVPVIVVNKKAYQKNVDGLIEPAGEINGADGYYYKGETNFVVALPAFNPDADVATLKDAEAAAFETNKKLLANLLQTLDASPLAAGKGFGAVALHGKIYYRGGDGDAVISAASKLAADTVAFGWFKDDAFTTLLSDYTIKNAVALAGTDYSVTEAMIAAGLKRLVESGTKDAVYVAHGQVWSLDATGAVQGKEEAVAAPVSWAVGHDVRGARMARGAKPAKCADCHTVDSSFFFAKVESTGPLMTAHKMVKQQAQYMGLDGNYNRLFGAMFLVRPLFKIFLWVVFGFVALVAIAFTAVAIPNLLTCSELYAKKNEALIALVDKAAAIGICAASAYLAISGLLGWIFHVMSGYMLVGHMLAGGLFTACLVALIFLRAEKRFADKKRSILWMIMLLLGLLVIFTATAPMMTWLGSGWQLVVLKAHRCVTFCFLAVCAWMMLTGGRKE